MQFILIWNEFYLNYSFLCNFNVEFQCRFQLVFVNQTEFWLNYGVKFNQKASVFLVSEYGFWILNTFEPMCLCSFDAIYSLNLAYIHLFLFFSLKYSLLLPLQQSFVDVSVCGNQCTPVCWVSEKSVHVHTALVI